MRAQAQRQVRDAGHAGGSRRAHSASGATADPVRQGARLGVSRCRSLFPAKHPRWRRDRSRLRKTSGFGLPSVSLRSFFELGTTLQNHESMSSRSAARYILRFRAAWFRTSKYVAFCAPFLNISMLSSESRARRKDHVRRRPQPHELPCRAFAIDHFACRKCRITNARHPAAGATPASACAPPESAPPAHPLVRRPPRVAHSPRSLKTHEHTFDSLHPTSDFSTKNFLYPKRPIRSRLFLPNGFHLLH